MAKAAWNRTIVDASGNVLPGADITVTDERTGTLATLFDDRDGNDAKSNPFVADTNGFARFFADAGVYRVVAESGALSRTWRFQSLLDNGVPITWTEDQIFTGDATVNGSLDVDGNATVNGSLEIDGNLTLSSGVDIIGDITFSGDNTFSGSTSGPGAMVNGKFVGEVFSIPGNHIAPSADFAAVSLTDFLETKTIDEANFPNLVPFLRAQKLIYLEELTGEATSFSGTAAGSVVTLSANAANEDLCAGLVEWNASNGAYPAVVIDAVTYEVTDVNAVTLAITLGEAPPAGATTLEVYPHRIASSTTTARLWSWVGKTAIGAGTTETLAMMMRRDQMQGHYHQMYSAASSANASSAIFAFGSEATAAVFRSLESATVAMNDENVQEAITDGTNGTPRIGTTTHSPDVSVHWYQWAGVVTGL